MRVVWFEQLRGENDRGKRARGRPAIARTSRQAKENERRYRDRRRCCRRKRSPRSDDRLVLAQPCFAASRAVLGDGSTAHLIEA